MSQSSAENSASGHWICHHHLVQIPTISANSAESAKWITLFLVKFCFIEHFSFSFQPLNQWKMSLSGCKKQANLWFSIIVIRLARRYFFNLSRSVFAESSHFRSEPGSLPWINLICLPFRSLKYLMNGFMSEEHGWTVLLENSMQPPPIILPGFTRTPEVEHPSSREIKQATSGWSDCRRRLPNPGDCLCRESLKNIEKAFYSIRCRSFSLMLLTIRILVDGIWLRESCQAG